MRQNGCVSCVILPTAIRQNWRVKKTRSLFSKLKNFFTVDSHAHCPGKSVSRLLPTAYVTATSLPLRPPAPSACWPIIYPAGSNPYLLPAFTASYGWLTGIMNHLKLKIMRRQCGENCIPANHYHLSFVKHSLYHRMHIFKCRRPFRPMSIMPFQKQLISRQIMPLMIIN